MGRREKLRGCLFMYALIRVWLMSTGDQIRIVFLLWGCAGLDAAGCFYVGR